MVAGAYPNLRIVTQRSCRTSDAGEVAVGDVQLVSVNLVGFAAEVEEGVAGVSDIFEQVFDHVAFTGEAFWELVQVPHHEQPVFVECEVFEAFRGFV